MSDQLDRIEKMLTALTEKTDQIEEKVENIEAKVEDMPTREELSSLGRTTDEVASGLEEKAENIQRFALQVEDKAEAGYVVLESLFHGLQDRVANLILESEQRTAEFTARMIMESEERITERMVEAEQRTADILQKVLELSQKQDERMTRMEDRSARMQDQISALSDITRAWIYKGNLIEKEVQELKRKMNGDTE